MQKQKLMILVAGFAVWGALLNGMDAAVVVEPAAGRAGAVIAVEPVAAGADAAEKVGVDARDGSAEVVVEGPVLQRAVYSMHVVELGPDMKFRRLIGDGQLYQEPNQLLKKLLSDLAENNSWEVVGQLFQHGIITTARGTVMLLVLVAPHVIAVGRNAVAAIAPYIQHALGVANVKARRGWNAAGNGFSHIAQQIRQRRVGIAA